MNISIINPGDLPLVVRTRGISIVGTIKKYETYEDMLRDRMKGNYAWVEDATGDPTVGTGSALYKIEDDYRITKLIETEAMDTENFGDGHTHVNLEVLNQLSVDQENHLLFNNLPIGGGSSSGGNYDAVISVINRNISNLTDSVTSIINETIPELQTNIASNTSAIGTFTAKFITLENNVTSLNNQITIVNTSVNNFRETLGELSTSVNTLQNDLTNTTNTLTTVQGRVAANETNIEVVQGSIASVNESISLLQTKDTELGQDITAVDGRVDTLNTKVSTIKIDVDTMVPRVNTLAADMISVKRHVTESEATLASHQGSIEQHGTSITDLTSRMEAVEAAVFECVQETVLIDQMV